MIEVLAFYKDWALVQSIVNDIPERKFIPRVLVPGSSKGPVNLNLSVYDKGLEYSNVDVVGVLGEYFNINRPIAESFLIKTREANLWLITDFERRPQVVSRLLKQQGIPVDTMLFLNVLRRRK